MYTRIISYKTLKTRTKRQKAGWGRLKGVSGVWVTPNKTKNIAHATMPLLKNEFY